MLADKLFHYRQGLNTFFSKKIHIFLIFLSLLQVGLTLYRIESIPNILYDESLYAYTALNVSTHYIFDHDFSLYSGKQFCIYPLFLGFFFKLFGPSLLVGRLFSLVLGLCSLLIFSRLILNKKLPFKFQATFLTLFVFFNTNIVAFRIIRPEALLIFFACLCLYCFDRYCSNTSSPIHSLGLGFSLAGLMGTHLVGAYFGVLFGVVFIYTLIQKKQPKLFFVFCIGFLPLSSVFIINLISLFSSPVLSNDLNPAHITNKILPSFQTFSTNFNTFFLDNYVLGVKRFMIVLVECGSLVAALIYTRSRFSLTLVSATLCFLIYGLFSLHFFLRPYFVLLPIISIVLIADFIPKLSKRLHPILFGLMVLLFCNHMAGNAYIFYKNNSNISFNALKNEILSLPLSEQSLHGERIFWFISPRLSWGTPTLTNSHFLINRANKTPMSGLTHSAGVYSPSNSTDTFMHTPSTKQASQLIHSKFYPPYGIIHIYKKPPKHP